MAQTDARTDRSVHLIAQLAIEYAAVFRSCGMGVVRSLESRG